MSQVLLKAPAPDVTYSAADGTPYIADGDGTFHAWDRHVASLLHHGCEVVGAAVKSRRRKKADAPADEVGAEDADTDTDAEEPELEDPEPEVTDDEVPSADEPEPEAPQAPVEPLAPDPAPEQG